MSPCEVAALLFVPLLLGCLCTARVLFKFRVNVRWNLPDCVKDGTQARRPAQAQKHRSWLSQREYLEVQMLLHHGCPAPRSQAGAQTWVVSTRGPLACPAAESDPRPGEKKGPI